MREIRVGLIGFGTVGAGVVKILQQNAGLIEKRMGTKIVLKRVADLKIQSLGHARFDRDPGATAFAMPGAG